MGHVSQEGANFRRIAACEWSECNKTIYRYMKSFISWNLFHGRHKIFIGSLHVNLVKVLKLYTAILRSIICLDMFHSKPQTFHSIAASEFSVCNETIHRDTEKTHIICHVSRKAQTFHGITTCKWSESNESMHRYMSTFTSLGMIHRKWQIFIDHCM
jgi:hypothetical protein